MASDMDAILIDIISQQCISKLSLIGNVL